MGLGLVWGGFRVGCAGSVSRLVCRLVLGWFRVSVVWFRVGFG